MKKWIRKASIVILIFGIIYMVLFNIIDISENTQVPDGATVITIANKKLSIASLSVIVVSVMLEIYMLIRCINKTVNPETFKMNLVKLILGTITIVIICTLCYYIYLLTNSTRFY